MEINKKINLCNAWARFSLLFGQLDNINYNRHWQADRLKDFSEDFLIQQGGSSSTAPIQGGKLKSLWLSNPKE